MNLGQVFRSDLVADGCWCMWFLISVKNYHAAGSDGNRASFVELAATSETPMGLLAYENDEPVGWCAVGPRSRYARAIKTPTYSGRDPAEDDDVWLAPCFFVRRDRWRRSVTPKLLEAAVGLAREHSATAVEGFPHARAKHSSQDLQVGSESVFAALGFKVIRSPSTSWVVMRLELAG